MSKIVNTLIVSKDGLLEIIKQPQTMDGLDYGNALRSKLREYRGKGIAALAIESTLFEKTPLRKNDYLIFMYRENQGRYMWTSYNRALEAFPDTPEIVEIAKSLNFLI